ncbi:TRAP transporter large permease subunit [Oceanobacillus sp. CFH 90083]|uniref:TRAP transporter large permease subunit n=1 Tax=Oceanobacillus sp. CFH 90083 TaxID=2592336 RepID=UPI0021053965|nr:TRAP transporter large permease subunit [Oceanobacillus sp. CFH 90083]
MTSMIFLIIASAHIFGMVLTTEQIPQQLSQWIETSSANIWIFLIAVNLMFFVLGMFLDLVSVILIALPILLPILAFFDFNLIHFAIIMIVNLELALITPPVGLNLFVVSGITREKVGNVVMGVLPFYVVLIIGLVAIIIFPAISLWLIR